MKLTLF